MADTQQLLAEYRRSGSETAFRELVSQDVGSPNFTKASFTRNGRTFAGDLDVGRSVAYEVLKITGRFAYLLARDADGLIGMKSFESEPQPEPE